MATRTVKVATWQYRDSKGRRRRAYFGDEIELPKDEIERGDRLGVFTPAPVPAKVSSELEKALAAIRSRTVDPAGADESDSLPTKHDVQPDAPAEPAPADVEPASDADPAEQPADVEQPASVPAEAPADEKPAEELKRPAKAAAHEKWVDYVHRATGRPADELAKLSKDELQAIEV
ncbi:head-tail connector protein [Mycobacterium phage Rem711]|uniref:Head-to-tail connector protein n=1 Tax=Mycobacterium phage Rem711 TaxID=2079285 RepID=A0A2K9VEV7_9CAUD|nr:head-tail connector protein [Mycobacterium phage Rem711]AUV60791.1 head-to-tail connector protein [Mycobacterium phage Rem711]